MGMQLLRTTDRPDQKYSLAFVGYADDRSRPSSNHLQHGVPITISAPDRNIAIGVDDIHGTCERVRAAGAAVTRERVG